MLINPRIISVGLMLVASGVSGQPAAEQTSGVPAFEGEPCPFWTPQESARYRVECGKLIVAASDVSQRHYRIQVAILRSLDDRLHNDAIVLIPGGPGQALVESDAARLAQHPLQDTLRQHRDIVLLDPRGTGYSEPGELCPVFETMEIRVDIVRLPFAERTSLVQRELAACRARLLQEGIDPAEFNSVALSRDLESLRVALGYDQLNLIGVSWGSRVALEMMRQFPASVRSALLYGPFASDGSSPGGLAARAGPSLQRLFDACEADAACRAEFPDIAQDFTTLLTELDANPMPVHTRWGSVPVDGAVAETVITYALYGSDFLRYVPLAIRELRRRNTALVEGFLQSAIGRGISGGFYYAAHCFELTPPLSADSIRTLRQRYPWNGRADRFAPDPAVVCGAFVPPGADRTVSQPVHSDVPTLILAGEFDPTTPPEYGERMSATLPSSHLVVLRARGHDVNIPNECTVQIRKAFLDNPTQAPDTSCVAQLPPLSFATNVHTNAGVPRLLTRLQTPVWPAAIALLLLLLIASVVLLPMNARTAARAEPAGRATLATGALWAAGFTALVFSVGLAVAITTVDDPYVSLFGVRGNFGWLFLLPRMVMVLTAAGVAGILIGWYKRWWSSRARALHTVAGLACVGFVSLVVQLELF